MMRAPDRKGKPKAPPPGSAEDLSDWGDNEDDNTLSSLSIQDVVESPPRTAGVFSGKSVIDGGAEGGFGVFGEDFGKEDEDDEDEVKVPIQLVNLTKRTLCCAAFGIGKQRVCMLPLDGDGFCQYRSHKGPPASWKAHAPGSIYVITQPPPGRAACLAPVLPSSGWSDKDAKYYVTQELTVKKWAALFATHTFGGPATSPDPSGSGKPMSPDRAVMLTKTPVKVSFGQSTMKPAEKVELQSTAFDKPGDKVVAALLEDVRALAEVSDDQAIGKKDVAKEQATAIRRIAAHVNMLQATMGDPGSTGAPTLYAGVNMALDGAKQAVDMAKAEVKKVKDDNAVLHELVRHQRADLDRLTVTVEGMVKALAATDSNLGVANGRWKAVYKAQQALGGALVKDAPSLLERRVAALEGAVGAGRQPGLGCVGQCAFTAEKAAHLTRLSTQVSTLETAVKSNVITLSTVSLGDLQAAKSWVVEMGGSEESPGAFVDVAHLAMQPLLLLDLVHAAALAPDSKTVTSIKNQQQVGMTDHEAVAAKSLSNLIPALFGNGLKANELSALPTYDSLFENHDGTEPLVDLITAGITDVETGVIQLIAEAPISATAGLMLNKCLSESSKFCDKLFDFMKRFYERYCKVLPPKEVWTMLQYLVRAVIGDMRRKLLPAIGIKWGDSHRTPDNAAKLLWSSFMAIKTARTYFDEFGVAWEGHPTLSPAINKFLLSNVVMKPTLDKFLEELALSKKEATEAKRIAEAAKAAVGRAHGEAAKKAGKPAGA